MSEVMASGPPIWAIIVTAVLGLLVYIYVQAKSKHNQWRKRGVSGPKVSFPLGTASIVDKPLHLLLRQWEEEHGKVYGICSGLTPILVISDAEIVKDVLIKNFEKFKDRLTISSGHRFTSCALINQNGESWRRDRAVISPTFSSGKMKHMYLLMRECYKSLDRELERLADIGDQVDVKRLFSKLTLMVIARCAFATQVDAFAEPNHQLLTRLLDIFKFSRWRILVQLIVPDVVKKWTHFSLVDPSIIEYVASVCQRILDYRKQVQGQGGNYSDLLQLLMESDDESFTDAKIIGNSIIFFNAGYETTSTLLTWISYALAKNPAVQETLHEEVSQVKINSGSFEYETLFDLKYLDAVINETLRMYPPVTMFDRIAGAEHTFHDGTKVLPGDLVRVATYSLHHSADYYSDPETFDPSRFMPENKESLVAGAFVPFVLGPRNCVGMRFALLEVKMALAEMICKYKFVASQNTPDVPKFSGNSFILSMDDYQVKVVKRHSSL